jgi:hypothetical protein
LRNCTEGSQTETNKHEEVVENLNGSDEVKSRQVPEAHHGCAVWKAPQDGTWQVLDEEPFG